MGHLRIATMPLPTKFSANVLIHYVYTLVFTKLKMAAVGHLGFVEELWD